ncbi:MAG: hypothetical protein DMG41_32795 [Acidobacteria bacterium]|nr:MAG: hypothetical protein AUH13_17100 [Acidobacteria bacterium 13_2_20CM_58_27]PYT76859.1 MAG: hypothetical protein DMG42_03855 [Acidobacteriota bacterium]PYT82722.1 MAG: hypothetical protein DMG41_32795 [Acidobacteriota bacterium]
MRHVAHFQSTHLGTNPEMLLARAKSAQGIMIHPGQTVNLDYSLTQAFPLHCKETCAFSLG